MISVAAFNAAGDGPRSLPTRGRTQQAGANPRCGSDPLEERPPAFIFAPETVFQRSNYLISH